MLADHLLRSKKEYKIRKETADSRYIYQSKLGKACFQHDLTFGNFGDLPGTTAFDKVLRDKTFTWNNSF